MAPLTSQSFFAHFSHLLKKFAQFCFATKESSFRYAVCQKASAVCNDVKEKKVKQNKK
jgi:hypothetical protein